jgi:hypothetical protein
VLKHPRGVERTLLVGGRWHAGSTDAYALTRL